MNFIPPRGEPSIDPEELAALLDGRLIEPARSRVIAALADSPKLLEIYANASAALLEVEADDRSTMYSEQIAAPPVRNERRISKGTIALFALAAVLVLAVAISSVREGRTSSLDLVRGTPGIQPIALGPPQTILALLSPSQMKVALPPSPWPVTRGAIIPAPGNGQAVRIGATIAELELQRAARMINANVTARSIGTMLDGINGGTVAGAAYRAIADAPDSAVTDAQLRSASALAERFVNARELRSGAWLAAVRVAALRQDITFVDATTTSVALDELRAIAKAAPGARVLIDALARALDARTRDWSTVNNSATDLLRELGRASRVP